jgi:hypothetical protein
MIPAVHRRPLGAAVAVVAALCVAPDSAASGAGERAVVVVPADPQQETAAELAAALRVHLGGGADVEVGAPFGPGGLLERFAHASSLVTGGDALLVVWVERVASAGPHDDYVVYAVGRDPSRALVEVVRVPADGRAGVVRIMALKISSLVDLVRAAGDPVDVEATFARVGAAPARRGDATFHAELGGVALGPAGDVGARAGLLLAVSLESRRDGRALSAQLAARWLTGVRVAGEGADLEVDELDLAVGLRALRRWTRVAAGLGVEAGVRVLVARGSSAGGQRDRALSLIPFAAAGAEGRASLTRRLELRLRLGVEIDAVRQRFLLLRQPAADLGRWRAAGEVSAVWTWR